MVRISEEEASLLQLFQRQWRNFYAHSQAEKDQFRTQSLRGSYMTPYPGLHEVFETKTVNVDPKFRLPEETEAVTRQVFAFCEKLALLALEILVGKKVSPESTLRVLHYDRNDVAKEALEKAFPSHTDSSLITIAPKSSMSALEMKRFDSGAWVCVEDQMSERDLVIFFGDAGAYLSGNTYPAPLHRPSVERMLAVSGSTRISSPFFLRGAAGVVLDPPNLPPLPIEHVENNTGGCRDGMPWKLQSSYYKELRYS